jgi:hypothetical protein
MSARIYDELAPTYEALKAERDAQQKRADALASAATLPLVMTDMFQHLPAHVMEARKNHE